MGITMLILGSFPDRIAEIQTIFRVGRFGDKCTRIRERKFPAINEAENAKRKGLIDGILHKIMEKKAKALKEG